MKLDKNTTLALAGTLIGLAGAMHLLRVVMGWTALLGSFTVPYWLSVVLGLLAVYISYELFMLRRKK